LLLLYGEQGFGDVIQFSRFVPQAIDSGGHILLSVRPELVTLFKDQFSDLAGVVSRDSYLPNHDLILPISSLTACFWACAFGHTKQTISSSEESGWDGTVTTFLYHCDAIAWASSPTQTNDRPRSLPLAELAPIAAQPNVEVFSVQEGPAVAQIAESGLAFCAEGLNLRR